MMINKPTRKMLELIPALYSQQDKEKDEHKVYMKFFFGNFRWYILEYDGKDIMFALVTSDIVPEGEFGYVSLRELMSIRKGPFEVDREIYQVNPRKPVRLGDILKQDGVRR